MKYDDSTHHVLDIPVQNLWMAYQGMLANNAACSSYQMSRCLSILWSEILFLPSYAYNVVYSNIEKAWGNFYECMYFNFCHGLNSNNNTEPYLRMSCVL